MRALITGAAGFCAKHLASRLGRQPGAVIAGLDLLPTAVSSHFADYFPADITDAGAVAAIVTDFKPDVVFHLAGVGLGSSNRNHAQGTIYKVNTVGAVNVLEAVLRHAPGCVVLLAGSAAEYGSVPESVLPVVESASCCPETPYGISKYAATLAGLNFSSRHGMKVVIARAFNIVGPGMPEGMLVADLIARAKQALQSPGMAVVQAGDLRSERDFVAVSDVVEAYVRLAGSGYWGEIFNICSGRPCSVQVVAEMLFANAPRRIVLEVNPSLVRPGQMEKFYGSYEKARRAIGYEPSVSLQHALQLTWEREMSVPACV